MTMIRVKVYRLWSDAPGYGWDLYQDNDCVGSSCHAMPLREYATPFYARRAAERYAKRWGYWPVTSIAMGEP